MVDVRIAIAGFTILLIGIATGYLIANPHTVTGASIEIPQGTSRIDTAMPHDRISENQIIVTPNHVRLDIENARWSRFASTKSMAPFLDTGANAIQIEPERESELGIGDIISYRYDNITIIHRIIDTGYDTLGWYAITQGDNNNAPDLEKVRFENVERVLVAIIY